MERFCKDLRKHATKIIDYEEKEMIPLADKEKKSYEEKKVCQICKKKFIIKKRKKKKRKKKIKMYLNYTIK